ncbi:hypothetical protein IU405_05145 [Polaribacter sp. BAL334]|uniref:hypothetical protein n=1 Tax=Polaribacter sp. BAL334 TaxID=1708178 RepID=UPI0018D20DF2|nr:hypothetical protein [Polaribacter sp. BAL334]MBG7611631.1 hypothetical protein [Polaribacter sp. BAL334]
MPYNLWIFPLLSGFYFLMKYKYNTYKYQRLDSQILIFHSILYGILIFLGLYTIRVIISLIFPTVIPAIYSFLYKLPIKKQDFLWSSLFCFIITFLVVEILNLINEKNEYFSWRKPVDKAIDEIGDEVEQLFKQSFVDKLFIQITLKNNKVYVGFADTILPPKETNYLKIVPLISGYRKSETKEVEFTTEYFEALDFYDKNPSKYNTFDMDIIVMQNEILTAQIFDWDIFRLFNYPTEDIKENKKSKKK